MWKNSGTAVDLNLMTFIEAENKESKYMHYKCLS